MVNKGPIKANRNMSHFTAVQIILLISFDWCIHPRSASLPIPLRNCCLIQVRESVAEIFYFFIDHIHLGVTIVSESLKNITTRVICETSKCRWGHQRYGKTQKTQGGEEKAQFFAGYVPLACQNPYLWSIFQPVLDPILVTFEPFSYSESPKKCDPILVTLLKNAWKEDPIIVRKCHPIQRHIPSSLLLKSTPPLGFDTVMENFISQMRSRNDMPTASDFAYIFEPTIRE